MDDLTAKLEDSKQLMTEITTKTASYIDQLTKINQLWSGINSSVETYKIKNEEASRKAEANITALGEKIKAQQTAYLKLDPNSAEARNLNQQIQQNSIQMTTSGINLANNNVITPVFLSNLFEKYFGNSAGNAIKDKTGAIISGSTTNKHNQSDIKNKNINDILDSFIPGDSLGKTFLNKVLNKMFNSKDTISGTLNKSATIGTAANAIQSVSTSTAGRTAVGDLAGNVAGNAVGGLVETGLSSIVEGGITDIASEVMGPLGIIIKILSFLQKGLSAIKEKVSEGVDDATAILTSDERSKADSRLYGLIENANEQLNTNMVDLASDAVALVENYGLQFMSAQDLITNMEELINQGVAYNIEQRALWLTMQDKIVSTFETTNETLLRLIQLQQSELTDTYMGVEASITRTLNSMFKDTQYLNNTYDTVWSNLTDTLANVDADLGTSIAYQVQLWLGSLSALGLSSDAASGISSAINSLLTGNIDGLGDEGKTLLAMAAAKQNMSFADILVNGIESGEDMSSFMQGIIEVLQDIYSESKDNNVLLSEWGEILNLSISDWKAISNLTESTVATLSGLNNYDQVSAKQETQHIEQNLVAERTTLAERIDNAIENTWFASGWTIASDAEDYAEWRVLNVLGEIADSLGLGIIETAIDLVGSIKSLNAAWDPLINLLDTGVTITTSTDYGNFYDSMRDDIDATAVGQFLGEFFNESLAASGYVNYSDIYKQSFFATQQSGYGNTTLATEDSTTTEAINSYYTDGNGAAYNTTGYSINNGALEGNTYSGYTGAQVAAAAANGTIYGSSPEDSTAGSIEKIIGAVTAEDGMRVKVTNLAELNTYGGVVSWKSAGSETSASTNYPESIQEAGNV